MTLIRTIIGAALAAALIPAAQADVTLTYSNPESGGGDMVLTVVGNRAGMLVPGTSGESTRMVYDQEQDKLFIVMDEQQQYMDMDAMMQSLGGLSDMLAGAMKNMPEESKGQLGDLLGGMLGGDKKKEPAPAPTITATGETDQVAGISCGVVNMQAAGETSELCLAKPSDAGVGDGDFQVLQGMMQKQAATAQQAGEMLGMRNMSFSPGKLDGVPLRVEQVTGENAGSRSELKSMNGSVDRSAVEIPANYQPASMLGG